MNANVRGALRAALATCLLLAAGAGTGNADQASPAAGARSAAVDQKAVLDLNARISSAQVRRDLGFLDAALAADLVFIGADGNREGKADYLRQAQAARGTWAYDTQDEKVHLYGNVAVVDGIEKVAGNFNGRKVSFALVCTKVFEYRGSGWQLVHWHSTIAPPPWWRALLLRLHGQ